MNETCQPCQNTLYPDFVDNTVAVGGTETTLVATDTSTINFTTSGTAGHNLTGSVRLSTTAGNILTSNGTGLYVPTPTPETALVATDTSTIDFTTSGTAGHALTASVKLSATAGNIATANADGIYVPAGAVTTGDLLGSNTATVATGTARLVGGNATVSVPLKITTAGTAVTAPTTTGGYQFQSTDGSVVITNPSAGVINLASSSADFYSADTATTGNVTATRATASSFTHYTAPFTGNRVHILSTTGAVLGDSMTVSVGYAGVDVLPIFSLEIRNATVGGTLIETFTDGLGIEGHYKFNGTAWVKVR